MSTRSLCALRRRTAEGAPQPTADRRAARGHRHDERRADRRQRGPGRGRRGEVDRVDGRARALPARRDLGVVERVERHRAEDGVAHAERAHGDGPGRRVGRPAEPDAAEPARREQQRGADGDAPGPVDPGDVARIHLRRGGAVAARRDRDDAPAAALGELHGAGGTRVQRVVAAHADALAGLEAAAALADDDLAAGHGLTSEHLHPEALGVRVASVAGGAEALLVRHYSPSSLLVLPPPGPTMSVTSMRVRFWRWPVRLRYPRLGLNLNTRSFSPRRCSTTRASTRTYARSSAPNTASSDRNRSGSSFTVAPASSGRRSTSRVCPFSTRYCLPPVLTIAYMFGLSLRTWSPPRAWQRNGAVRLCGRGAEASILRHRLRPGPPAPPPRRSGRPRRSRRRRKRSAAPRCRRRPRPFGACAGAAWARAPRPRASRRRRRRRRRPPRRPPPPRALRRRAPRSPPCAGAGARASAPAGRRRTTRPSPRPRGPSL